MRCAPKKRGHKVTGLEFRIKRNPQRQLELGGSKPKRKFNRAEIAERSRPSQTWKQAAVRIKST